MTEAEFYELRHIARSEAMKALTVSGGYEMEDVIQNSLEEYLNYIAKHEVENPGGLIRIIARRRAWKFRDAWEAKRSNLALDRKGNANKRVPRDTELSAETGDPFAALLRRGDADLVNYAVGQLDPTDSEIIRLTYLSDPPRSGPEVAERVGLAAGSIRNRLVDLRRILARLLEHPPE